MLHEKKRTISKRKVKNKIYAADIFCGAGGLTNGLESVGIDVRLGVDIDSACHFPYSYNNNAKFLLRSVEDLQVQDIEEVLPKDGLRLLAGCAPCQTFSTYNRKADQSDKRWWLLLEFLRLVRDMSPELVTMENVPELIKQSVFKDFVRELEKQNYYVNYSVVKCAEYGIPQERKRLVLLASKIGPIEMLSPSVLGESIKTVREAIGDLPPLTAGQIYEEDPLHQSAALSPLNLQRIKASRPGGTWRDWKEELITACHKKNSGKSYPGVYGRMSWDQPAPTMTTQFYGYGNGRFGHPEQDRAISLREGAIFQGFPRDYMFTQPGDPITKNTVGRLIGNAVPVKLGEVIGRSILHHLDICKVEEQA